MRIYAYKIIDYNGNHLSGTIQANSYGEALKLIPPFKKEYYIRNLGSGIVAYFYQALIAEPLKMMDVVNLFDQFKDLLQNGYSQTSAMTLLSQYGTKNIIRIATIMNNDLLEGYPFSEICYKYRNELHGDFSKQIKVGEDTAILQSVLESVARQLETTVTIRKKIISSLIYPIFLILACVGVLLYITITVIPQLLDSFTGLNFEMPRSMLIMFSISNFLILYWKHILVVLLVLILLSTWSVKKYFMYQWNVLKTMIPFFGKIFQMQDLIYFYRYMGFSIKSNIPTHISIQNAISTVSNLSFRKQLKEVANGMLLNGTPLDKALRDIKWFSGMELQAISVGLDSGKISDVLLKLSDARENQLNSFLSRMVSIITPTLMISVGIVVGFLTIGLYGAMNSIMVAL